MLVFEDITEFLATKKMAINAELARQVAHEIKNPLTPIQLSVQLLRPGLARPAPRPGPHRGRHGGADPRPGRPCCGASPGEFSLLGRPDDLVTGPLDLADLVTEVVAAYGAPTAASVAKTEPPAPGAAGPDRRPGCPRCWPTAIRCSRSWAT